jgi:copper oxidase (laccase) domain-containing protein
MFTSPLLDHPAIVRRQRERAGVEAVAARDECTMCHARADGRWTFRS